MRNVICPCGASLAPGFLSCPRCMNRIAARNGLAPWFDAAGREYRDRTAELVARMSTAPRRWSPEKRPLARRAALAKLEKPR